MHAGTLRLPWASRCIKVSMHQLKPEFTTAGFDPEACSSARETRIGKPNGFVRVGHDLVRPPDT